jgi:hypothetical protein
MRISFFTLVLCMVSVLALAQDPVKTDGDKYKVILENDRVRVIEYRDKPGDKTSLHQHPDFVMHVVDPFMRRLTFEDGRTVERSFAAGQTSWMEAETYWREHWYHLYPRDYCRVERATSIAHKMNS